MADKTMADKTRSHPRSDSDKEGAIYNPYAAEYEGGNYRAHEHKPSWTDGFPHDFHGWGPQTPEPDDEHVRPAMADDLTWRGQGGPDSQHHVIWRFDRHRHH